MPYRGSIVDVTYPRSAPRSRPLSLEACLAVVEDRLGAELLTGLAAQRLRGAARLAPPARLGIVEVRLAPDQPQVDLSLRRTRPELDPPVAPQEPDREGIHALWLEFDLDQDRADLPPPTLCAQLAPEVDTAWLADSLLPALHGRALGAAQREQVLFCTRAIPPPARLLYAFSLLSRPGEAVRLEILGLGPPEARAYLARVAPHVLPTLAEIAPLLAAAENPHLSFDIDAMGSILPRIGFEGAFPRQPSREPRWAALFDRMVGEGLCSPEKRDAVLAWPGKDSFWTAPEHWPVEAIGVRGVFVRFLSHLKVVGEPGRPPLAKAYLGFQYLLAGSIRRSRNLPCVYATVASCLFVVS